MSSSSPLGAPPGNDDPAGQVKWLMSCVDAFAEKNDPRVQPLRDKLFLTLGELKPDMSPDDVALLNAVKGDVADLIGTTGDTYEEELNNQINALRENLRIEAVFLSTSSSHVHIALYFSNRCCGIRTASVCHGDQARQ